MSQKRMVANRFGRVFQYAKEKVEQLEQLKPGDHIVYENNKTYWHHMIVESIDCGNKVISVIHYACKNSLVVKGTLHFSSHTFYRIVYPERVKCFTASEVLSRAEKRLGNNGYGLICNNCEHFATECTTGRPKSLQVWTLVEITTKGSLVGAFTPRPRCFQRINTAKAKFPTFKVALPLSVISELVLTCKDTYEAYKKKEAGEISTREYCEVIVKRVASGVSSVPMSLAGAALAQVVIPIPGVGGMVGGVVGGMVGGIVGDFAGKVVGGFVGDLFVPIFTDSSFYKRA